MNREILHSILIMLVLLCSFLIARTPLTDYSLQIIALVFVAYFMTKRIFKHLHKADSRLLDALLFAFIIVTLINTTGGVQSSLFFLNFFLLFALSLLLEPIISISTTLALVALYILALPDNQSLNNLVLIFSLPFLTPFALFLAHEYHKNAEFKAQNEKLQTNSSLFLSLILKDHFKEIKDTAENAIGEREKNRISHTANRAIKLIERYEKEN